MAGRGRRQERQEPREPQAGRPRRRQARRSRVVDVRPVPRQAREDARPGARLRSPRLHGHVDLARRRADGGLRDEAPRAAGPVRRLRAEAGGPRGQARAVLGPGLRARLGVHAARAAARGRARRRGHGGRHDVRAVRRRLPEDQGPPGQLRHQRLQEQVDLVEGRADPGVRPGAQQRAAAPHVRGVQDRLRRHLRPRGALPRLGLQEHLDWSRSDQLDACLAGKPTPKAPHRMCERCHGIYQTLKDVERACRRAGCKGTWLDKRGAQLARAVRGKTGRALPAVLRELREGARRSRGSPDRVQDRQLHGHLDVDEGRAARGGRAARARRKRHRRRSRRSSPSSATAQLPAEARGRARPAPRRRGQAPGRASAPAAAAAPTRLRPQKRRRNKNEATRDPAARAPLPDVPRVPGRSQDDRDRLPGLQDAHLLAAREPAPDAPRRLGRAGAVRRVQARPHGGAARRPARGAAPPASLEAPGAPEGDAPAMAAPAEPPAPEAPAAEAPAAPEASS